jgi:undecaprenyl-diphosphatase
MLHVPQGPLWDLDRTLMLSVNGSWGAGWDTFWWLVTQPWFWTPLFVATLWLLWRRMGWRGMLLALGFIVLGLALADQTANFFKTHTPKFRPTRTLLLWEGVPYNTLIHTVRGYIGGNFGTVSGHAATAMAIGVTAAGIVRRRWFSLAIGVYVVFTAFSRLYLGVHFPLDILFGLTAGTLIGLLMVWLWNLTVKKYPNLTSR